MLFWASNFVPCNKRLGQLCLSWVHVMGNARVAQLNGFSAIRGNVAEKLREKPNDLFALGPIDQRIARCPIVSLDWVADPLNAERGKYGAGSPVNA